MIGVLISVFVLKEALPALQSIGVLRFFRDEAWYPLEGQFNLAPILLGTVLTALGGIAISTPLGLLSALFCQFYAPKMIASIYQRLLELLAGIPSVVYGFWGLVVLVPKINQLHPPGQSLLAGILILSLMILPTVALLSITSLGDVPVAYLQGAEALSLSRWTTLTRLVLPTARSGLITAIVLATGRALGETMAVLMVCGNVVQIPNSIFDPVRSLAANIALEMAYATTDHRSVLFVSGLVLLGLVGLLVMIASGLGSEERGKRYGV
jgi:phosphate transport system permease protein